MPDPSCETREEWMVWPILTRGRKPPPEKDLLEIMEVGLTAYWEGDPTKDWRVESIWERSDVGYQVYCVEA